MLAILYAAVALARGDALDGGHALAGHLQAAWLIANGEPAEISLFGNHILANHLPVAFYPIAHLTRWVPAEPLLLGLQSSSLAIAVVPLWRIARGVAKLRVGATAALAVAYAAHPAVNAVNLADFHTATLAVGPLMAAAHAALEGSWRRCAIFATLAVACDSDLGLLVAGIGVMLIVEGHGRVGLASVGFGLGWTALAVLVLQPRWGTAGLVGPGAFAGYGESAFDVLIAMVQNPIRVLGDLVDEVNVETVVLLFAPLLFLPALAPRILLAAVPLQALYFVAAVSLTGPAGAHRSVPILVFAFVAATMALARIGRRSIERVLVDRRVLVGLVVATLGFWLVDADSSPYRTPWRWGRADELDEARRGAAALADDDQSVRAADPLLSLLAERTDLRALARDAHNATAAGAGVDVVMFDATWAGWSTDEVVTFTAALDQAGFDLVYRVQGVSVFTRVIAR